MTDFTLARPVLPREGTGDFGDVRQPRPDAWHPTEGISRCARTVPFVPYIRGVSARVLHRHNQPRPVL